MRAITQVIAIPLKAPRNATVPFLFVPATRKIMAEVSKATIPSDKGIGE